MTRSYLVTKKAGDLMLGDRFAGWSLELMYGDHKQTFPAKRVLNYYRQKDGKVRINLDDGSTLTLLPEMMVAVEVLA